MCDFYLKFANNLLLEQKIPVVNTIETFERFFPTIYSEIKGRLQYYIPVITKRVTEDMEYFNNKTQGLPFDIFLNDMSSPNCWTLPSAANRTQAQLFMIPISGIFMVIRGMSILGNNLENTTIQKNNKINFKLPSNFKISIYETKGIKSMLNQDLLFSVWLHEIGHWLVFKNIKIAWLLNLMQYITKFDIIIQKSISHIFFIFSVLINIYTRLSEKDADMFVKKLGYNKELAEALRIIGYGVRTNASWVVKLSDLIKYILIKLQDIIDPFIGKTIYDHPSIKSRTKSLEDSYICKENEIININKKIEILNYSIQKLLIPFDKFTGKIVKDLYKI